MDCAINVAKTKALISFAVTAKLICVFAFAYSKSRFSYDTAHMSICNLGYFQNLFRCQHFDSKTCSEVSISTP